MRDFSFASRMGIVVILFVAAAFALTGCGSSEAEQRKAFAAFLQSRVLDKQGVALEPLSREEEKAFGGYKKHYAVLETFQKNLISETARNAQDLIALAEMKSLSAVAKSETALKKATKDAKNLREATESLEKKAEKAKAGLEIPEDLAPVYNAAFEKVVTSPANAGKTTFDAVYDVFSATIDLIDFINANSRDMEIAGMTINVKNPGLMDDLYAKMTVVQEKSAALREAYAAMMQALL